MTIAASLRGGFSMRIPLAFVPPTISGVYTFIAAAGAALGIAGTLGLFAWITVPKAILYARWRYAERRLAIAETGLSSISAGFEALDRRVEQLLVEVRAGRDETAAARAETAASRAETALLRMSLAEATTYIVSVVRHFRQRTGTIATMPEPPASIRDAIEAGIRAHDDVVAP
jgi:hypothetical protein